MADSEPSQKQRPQLRMRRPNLHDLPPPIPLPSGYRLWRASVDDAPGIAALLQTAFQLRWDAEEAKRELLENESVPVTFVIFRDLDIVATASFQIQESFDGSGFVHWVAALPTESGKGLGKAVSLAAMRAAQEAGKSDAYLTTDDFRLPAIKTYLALGFEPDPWHEDHPERWRQVFETLKRS